MGGHKPKVPASLRALLDESGLPWRVVRGGRHHKLVVSGRLVQVLPRGTHSSSGRGDENMLASVRRRLREMGGET